jgi:hypothetical protein
MSNEAGKTIQFKLTKNVVKSDLKRYALNRGFSSVSAMAKHAFYTYLAKCHYPLETAQEDDQLKNARGGGVR